MSLTSFPKSNHLTIFTKHMAITKFVYFVSNISSKLNPSCNYQEALDNNKACVSYNACIVLTSLPKVNHLTIFMKHMSTTTQHVYHTMNILFLTSLPKSNHMATTKHVYHAMQCFALTSLSKSQVSQFQPKISANTQNTAIPGGKSWRTFILLRFCRSCL